MFSLLSASGDNNGYGSPLSVSSRGWQKGIRTKAPGATDKERMMFDFEPTDEQKLLIETASRFARDEIMPLAAECDRDGKFPTPVMEKAH